MEIGNEKKTITLKQTYFLNFENMK